MSKMYEVHKVDPSTGAHLPILIGIEGAMEPAKMDEAAVQQAVRIATDAGAKPIKTFSDGRIQTGHYMFVPEETAQ